MITYYFEFSSQEVLNESQYSQGLDILSALAKLGGLFAIFKVWVVFNWIHEKMFESELSQMDPSYKDKISVQ